ncbi:MAG: universal stress protein [Planctomycetales bacterium]|nr:universal stress protein [Planctomycetales bacterium]
MDSLDNVIVATSLGSGDTALVQNVAQLVKAYGSARVTLAHFRREVDLPEEMANKYGRDDSAEQRISQHLEALREAAAWPDGTKVETVIRRGRPRHDLIALADELSADLIGISSGDKTVTRWGLSIDQIAHAAPCSLLGVPSHAPAPYRTILVPIDFSEHAADALRTARRLASACPDCRLIAQHVYEVPLGYYHAGVDFDEFANSVRQHAEKRWHDTVAELGLMPDEFVARFDLLPRDHNEVTLTDMILDAAGDVGADLIVCGARGQTTVARFFLGSTSEGVLREAKTPVLCVKRKSEHVGLLKSFLRDEW